MIHSWRLANFKAIDTLEQPLDFRAITLFSGPNSSGKSTIIQSILLMMQTMANRDDVPLQLNGELVSLGQCRDVWHHGRLPGHDERPDDERLHFQMVIADLDDAAQSYSMTLDFSPQDADGSEVQLVRGEYTHGPGQNPAGHDERIVLTWDPEDGRHRITHITTTVLERIQEDLYRDPVEYLNADIDGDLIEGSSVRMEDFFPVAFRLHARLRKQVPRKFNQINALVDPFDFPQRWGERTVRDLTVDEDARAALREAATEVGVTLPARFASPDAPYTFGDYKDWVDELPAGQFGRLREDLRERFLVQAPSSDDYRGLRFFQGLQRSVTAFFTQNIRYLSAYRVPPKLLYAPNITANWSDVGTEGEKVAPVLRDYGSRHIQWWNPQSEQIEEAPLLQAVITWMQVFELADDIMVSDSGKLGTLLKLRSAQVDYDIDLTSVGFGTSQVLPVIVQGLYTPPGAIFIVEQPEVHLHPRLQGLLADFFLSLIRCERQVIVETHSEHIVNRLRLRIAADDNDALAHQVRVYFVEKYDGRSHYRTVNVNEYGAILDWPRGFFDQSADETLEILNRARAKSRQRRETRRQPSSLTEVPS